MIAMKPASHQAKYQSFLPDQLMCWGAAAGVTVGDAGADCGVPVVSAESLADRLSPLIAPSELSGLALAAVLVRLLTTGTQRSVSLLDLRFQLTSSGNDLE